MASELEITKQIFYSDCHNAAKTQNIAIEDSRFLNFTEFLDETDVFTTPTVSRKKGTYKNGNWGLLGYCCNSYQRVEDYDENIDEENVDEENVDEENVDDVRSELEFKWEYTLFNGFFCEDVGVENATKLEITKAINEVTRFIEKTFANNLINDICETKDLQTELLKQDKSSALERLDICIITDKVINQDKLETKVRVDSLNLECRIYYWDLKRWNDLKRSKSKRDSINIDFQSKEFSIYNVDYLERKVNDKLSYYLAVFPGDLIADLYDYHNTRLLENNVRVFLSATRPANKAIRETIKNDVDKFFSFNNGISATAESVTIEDSKIVKINDFQIVNGGQTTASIHYSRKISGLNLKKVFVAVKITELKKDKEYGTTVSNISKAANTQTAIKKSDFYANDYLLVGIERFSLKNPVFNNESNLIYYFFERMAGQYNVTKNNRGTKRNITIWESKNPKKLSYNKLDVARWYNIMEELPHIAADGSEKQFKSFMDEKYFKRKEISIGRYKTLIGFGMLFNRARKLCGTKKGKDYPSIIGDSSVGMSTTIYSMAYLHFITKGCIDYWGIYDYNYGVCNSLVEKKRKATKFDGILESVIKACWAQISVFGGSSVQEQTKKNPKCWEYVKQNINISNSTLKQLKKYEITSKEKESRDSEILNEEDNNYFSGLNVLLEKNALILRQLLVISENQSDFKFYKATIKNQIKKIKTKKSILSKSRVNDMYSFYLKLKSQGYNFGKEVGEDDIKVDVKCDDIFSNIFSNRVSFHEISQQFIMSDNSNFEENVELRDEIIQIIEKFDREYGLSINDLTQLEKGFKFLN